MNISLPLVLFVFIIQDATAFRGFTSLFGKGDKNRDGGLSSRELIAIGHRFGIQPGVILEALRLTDSDGNRVLNPSEFERLQDSIDGTGQIRGRASNVQFNSSAISRMHQSRSEDNANASSSNNTAQPIVDRFLKMFDNDTDGELSQLEVERMFAKHGMPFSVAEEAFRMADQNGDEQLDASELITFYHKAQTSVSNYAKSQRLGQQKRQPIEARQLRQFRRRIFRRKGFRPVIVQPLD